MRKALLLFVCSAAVLTGQAAAQCPAIKVIGPSGITNPGKNVVFQAEINVVGPKLEFHWSVDKGTIIGGQGTTKITVVTDRSLEGQSITATMTVRGLPSTCESTASESAGIDTVPRCGLPMDEWGPLKPNDERGRLDVLFAELANNPSHVGLLVFRITSEERLDSGNSRIQFVLKHAKFRKVDVSQIWFVLEPSEERSTRLYRIPPGADPPACEDCLLFKGEHL